MSSVKEYDVKEQENRVIIEQKYFDEVDGEVEYRIKDYLNFNRDYTDSHEADCIGSTFGLWRNFINGHMHLPNPYVLYKDKVYSVIIGDEENPNGEGGEPIVEEPEFEESYLHFFEVTRETNSAQEQVLNNNYIESDMIVPLPEVEENPEYKPLEIIREM